MYYRLLPTLLFSILFSQTSMSNDQLDLLRSQLSESSELVDINTLIEQENDLINEDFEEVTIPFEEDIKSDDDDFYFGYSYFKNEINFFDNTPTSADYRLGAGDEIILSLWGEVNSREKIIINKEGLIYFENIGFINISNMTLEQAEKILKDRLQNIYSTLKKEVSTTDLMIEVSNLKSLNIYLAGEVQIPGVHLVHPFSDIFSALIQAGGPTLNGSLREIQLIRNGEIISSTDLYTFFNSGLGNFSSEKLLNGDVINVPPVGIRVLVEGEFNNLGYYELLENETVDNLISYAGGLTSNSSNKAIINDIIPRNDRISDDVARTGKIISLSNSSKKMSLNDGSTINILPISDNQVSVEVFGRVNFPGEYPLYKNLFLSSNEQKLEPLSLKELLNIVGGFEDPVFRKTINDKIVVLRLNENQFYGEEFIINYADANNFTLNINDKIFVYENSNYENSFTYTIEGEVNSPGTYPLKEGTTLKDAIQLANGVSPMGSINSVSVTKEFASIDEDGNTVLETALVGNIDLSFQIAENNIITILPKTNVVRVDGNVYNPGFVAFDGSMNMAKAIELAGGYKPYSLKKNVYVIRANGEIEKSNLFRGRAKRIFPGDSVFVPSDPNPSQFDVAAFTADILAVLTNLAAILVIVDNNSD